MGNHEIGQLSAMLRRVLPESIVVRHDLRIMQSWSSSPRGEQAARAVEARLFFDPPLLEAARRAQGQRRWQARILAALLITVIGAGAPVGMLRAEDAPADVVVATTSEDGSIIEWLLDVFALGGDDGGSVDPESGDPL